MIGSRYFISNFLLKDLLPRDQTDPEVIRQRRANESITRMVISICFLFLFSNIGASIARYAVLIKNVHPTLFLVIPPIGHTLMFLAQSSGIFIYFSFDKVYRAAFKSMFANSNSFIKNIIRASSPDASKGFQLTLRDTASVKALTPP